MTKTILPDSSVSDYTKKEIEFLTEMNPKAVDTTSSLTDGNHLILILCREVQLGVKTCNSLQSKLGGRVRVLRSHKPMTLSMIKEFFNPEVILTDSQMMFITDQKSVQEIQARAQSDGLLFFMNKKNSSFYSWISGENRIQHIFDAWRVLNTN